jgi:hypothetical protein
VLARWGFVEALDEEHAGPGTVTGIEGGQAVIESVVCLDDPDGRVVGQQELGDSLSASPLLWRAHKVDSRRAIAIRLEAVGLGSFRKQADVVLDALEVRLQAPKQLLRELGAVYVALAGVQPR